jgi:predicted transcriptional regulator of viral defense system
METRMTSAEVGEVLGIDPVTVRTAFGGLTRAGYIERLGNGGTSHRRLVVP